MLKKIASLKIKRTYIILSSFLLLLAGVPLIAFGSGALSDAIDGLMWAIVNNTAGRFVYYGGMLLNYAIMDFVVGFGKIFNDSGLGFAVNNLWSIIRDLFNLTFIFGLVYIGFKMILDSSNSSARRLLVNIFLAALLVNFSLYFAKFVVDFSNIAASQIAAASVFKMHSDISGTDEFAVSNRFMDLFGLSEAFSPDGTTFTGNGSGFGYIFFTFILYMVTGFVFFAGGVLLIIRFVVLIFYIILSPVMFIGWVFPSFASYSSQYWRAFLGRAFFAPAYLLMLFISMKVFTEFGALRTSGINTILAPTNGAPSGTDFGTTLPYFIIMCVFLLGSIMVANKMGAEGASMSLSVGHRGRRAFQAGMGAVTLGLLARGAQSTVGAGASSVRNSQQFKNFAAKYDRLGRAANKALQKTSESSFDARNVVGNGEAGKGLKGGYAAAQRQREKERKGMAEFLEKSTRDANNNLIPEVSERINKTIQDNQAKTTQERDSTAAALQAEKDRVNDLKEQNNYSAVAANVETLTTSLADATASGDTSLIAETQKQLDQEKANLAKLDDDIKDQTKDLGANLANINASLAEFSNPQSLEKMRNREEAYIKYADTLAYRDRLEKSGENNKYKNWGMAAGAAVGTAVLAPVILPVLGAGAIAAAALGAGVVAGATSKNKAAEARAAANSITKEYGRDGLTRVKNVDQKRKLRILSDEIKINDADSGAASA